MTRIIAATLQAFREQMAASLQRMHELEEQVKAIPVLQVFSSFHLYCSLWGACLKEKSFG